MVEIFRTTCSICQIGCGVLAHVDAGRVVKIEGDPDSPLNKGTLCPKGLASIEYLYHPDRLRHPLKRAGKRGEGRWTAISWDEALDIIAGRLAETKQRYGAESVAFLQGSFKGGTQGSQLIRFSSLFGSPNCGYEGHICFAPRRRASLVTYGFYAIPDFEYTPSAVVIWGKNLAENLHHVYHRMIRAVERGARLMCVLPNKVEGMDRVDLWLKPRPGSDLALALGMLNVIIQEGLYDSDFVRDWTVGFDELKAHVRDYPPEKVAAITWVPAEMIRKAARFYATAKPAALHWGNGIDSGVNSFQTARALCILRTITGNLETPGGDVRWLPVPVDPFSPAYTLSEKISPEVRRRSVSSGKVLPGSLEVTPTHIFDAILTGDPYPVRALYNIGCNPMLSNNDTLRVHEALNTVGFLVVGDQFMTPTAAMADIVLPVATYLEFNDVVVPLYSMPVALMQQKVVSVAECRSDYEILRGLAQRLGFGEYFWEKDEQFLDFMLKSAGLSCEEFKKVVALVGSKKYRSYLNGGFPTPSGKVELFSSQLKEWGFDPLPVYHEDPETPLSAPELLAEYPLMLTNRKSRYYRHSGGRQIASLREPHPEPIVCLNPGTAEKLGIADGDYVYIETERGRIKQKASLSSEIDPAVALADYGWWFPEDGAAGLYGWAKANVNLLTGSKPPYNREMGSTNLRGLLCKVYKAS